MTFVFDPRRDAASTIAGFVFQVNTTIVRWLNLQANEVLELECGEDIDIVRQELGSGSLDESRLMEQTKRRSNTPLTLRRAEALEAIANFCEHRRNNCSIRLRFRYLTTTGIGLEQGWKFDGTGITTWEAVRSGELTEDRRSAAIAAIGELLRECKPPKRCKPAWQCVKKLLRSSELSDFTELIQDFEWSVDATDYAPLEAEIKQALLQFPNCDSIEAAQQIFERLFLYVFKCLARSGAKRLTPTELTQEIQTKVVSHTDHALFLGIRRELDEVLARVANIEKQMTQTRQELGGLNAVVGAIASREGLVAGFEFITLGISVDPPDPVSPSIPRQEAVNSVLEAIATKTLVAIIGEPGSGKTQLSLLAIKQTNLTYLWLSLPRACTEESACKAIDNFVAFASGTRRQVLLNDWYERAAHLFGQKLIIIDDLPRIINGSQLARRLELLTNRLQRNGGKLLVTSYYSLPSIPVSLAEVNAPRMTADDVQDLLVAYGAPPLVVTPGLCDLISTLTRGVAVLATAIIRHFANKAWSLSMEQMGALLSGEFTRAERQDAKLLIELTVPDSDTRELLYRLSLIIGGFTRDLVAKVAAVPSIIKLPGERLDRLIGLWVQPFVQNKFIQSPLVDASVSAYLDPSTSRRVHAILAWQIMGRKQLEPLDVFSCVHHFTSAGLENQAAIVLIQALSAIVEQDANIEDAWGISGLWASVPIPEKVDVNLRLYLRALQIFVLDSRGRQVSLLFEEINGLLAEAGERTWGVAISSSFLAIRFCRKYPKIANQFLLKALRSLETATLPDGSALPLHKAVPPLEGILWATATASVTDSDIESWIETVSDLNEQQAANLSASDLADDNSTILTDGIWLREYRGPEPHNWDRVEHLVRRLEELGKRIRLIPLHVAAIRTRIMILAEWKDKLEEALRLAADALQTFLDDKSRFLILEVTGRQLSYAKRSADAIAWLQTAHALPIRGHALWRRNVLITLAEEVGKTDVSTATKYTRDAVELSRIENLDVDRVIEALAEHSLALWNSGQREEAFESLAQAATELLNCERVELYWKKLFLVVFHFAVHMSTIVHTGKPPIIANYVAPEQGSFLGLDSVDVNSFNSAQRAFLRIRMAIFAESIGKVRAAGRWADDALRVAAETPDARTIYSFAWLSIAPAMLIDDYDKAVSVTLLMANAPVPEAVALARIGITDSTAQQGVQKIFRDPGKTSIAMLVGPVPIAFHISTLKLQGLAEQEINAKIEHVATLLSDGGHRNISTALKEAFVEAVSWAELWNRGSQLMSSDTAAGIIYFVGAVMCSPLHDALAIQIWLARHGEKLFEQQQSMQREIIWPFFGAFWNHAVSASALEFRTAESYTRSRIGVASPCSSIAQVKLLLNSMAFCLGGQLAPDSRDWLQND
jgi:hypothetical protein